MGNHNVDPDNYFYKMKKMYCSTKISKHVLEFRMLKIIFFENINREN